MAEEVEGGGAEPGAAERRRPGALALIVAIGVAALALLGFNLSITAPVAAGLAADDRNAAVTLVGYRSALLHPTEITLDLWAAGEGAAPLDLFRGLMQAAEALKDRRFSQVTLARGGRTVFVLDGADFQALGAAYAAGENPVYLIRTFPEKLHTANGQAAYGAWEGGWLGVLTRQLEDANAFAEAWATGSPPGEG